ncbi:ATP-binding cassette sub-family C member 11-like isoform X1 [Microplitis mediator]|uniref:ATP-binding cassette sub-family C member 11-like isoform X1 n=2 Tax=Microplitis mediator TaxID=375433 RepID=UPI0025523613|nr:ATP-binding cassette sub-family C member 11-like isoform X1 [Microplitis mediator]
MSSSSLGIINDACTSFDNNGQGKLLPRKKNDKYSSTYVQHNRLSRYTTALANCVPVRFKKVPGSEIPLDKIGLLSSVSFSWINEYITDGCKNGLRDKPLPSISTQESCQVNGSRIDTLWHNHVVERGQAGASVPKIAWHFVKTRVLVSSFIYFLGMFIALSSPIIVLQKIIIATEDRVNVTYKQNTSLSNPVIINATKINLTVNNNFDNYSNNLKHEIMIDQVIIFSHIGILITAEVISYFLIAWSASLNLRTATRLRSACLTLAYKKLIKSSVRFKAPVHQTLTYFVPESKTLYELITNGPLIFSGPLILLISSLYIWYSMGHWALIGIATLIILYLSLIMNAYLTNLFATRAMNYSLRRLSLLEEFINKIYFAKITQWDRCFVSRIQGVRKKELGEIKLGALSEGCSLCMVHVIPIVTVSVMTMAYLFTHQQIISVNYIPCLILILINLKHCVRSSWLAMSSISHGLASLNKLKTVLILKDCDRYTDKPIDKNYAITINSGHFSWDYNNNKRHTSYSVESDNIYVGAALKASLSPELIDINFYVPKGKLIGICGASGSGKSSLLLAIMGQLNRINGQVTIDGNMSYVPEDFNLFEGTLKENIVMNESFDSSWYYKSIQACNLTNDISLLPGSDDTDVHTVELTMIQKQKIALARAVYTNRDINLLDNPLRDLDKIESLEIFDKAIVQVLGLKSVVMITDKVQYLKRCDLIYLMKNGKVVEHGKHEELCQWNKEYDELTKSFDKKFRDNSRQLLVDSGIKSKGLSSATAAAISSSDLNLKLSRGETDFDETTRGIYGVRAIDYRAGGKCLGEFVCAMALLYSIPIAASPLIFFYISQKTLVNTTHIAIILASVVGFIIALGLTLTFIYNKDIFNAAKNMHERWLKKINRAHISIFSTVSSSALINICSHDLQEVDYTLPKLKITILMHFGISLFTTTILGIICPWLLLPMAIFISIIIIYQFYIRQLVLALNESRIESVTPIYNHVVSTVNERITIQAYRKERDFAKKFYKYCDANTTYDFMLKATKLWMEYRIKLISAVTLAAVIIICAAVNGVKDRYQVLGLGFICTIQLTQSLVHLTAAIIDVYGSLMTVGFVDNYIQNIPQEIKDNNDRREWPLIPSIHFQNVLLINSTDHEPFNFSIYAGEKVAIHGSNTELKSHLVKVLLQFDQVFSGNILIGNLNIVDINIDVLRQYVDYIPRVPILFNGTIKYNLEPHNRRTDKEIMEALQKVFLWEKISKLDDKLDSSAGNLFSVTEKKLLSLARIYLNSTVFNRSIIIIEDLEPDSELINNILQDVFKDFTIIVLSSSLNWNAQRIIKLKNTKETGTSMASNLLSCKKK